MPALNIALPKTGQIGETISSAMFGGNFLFDRDRVGANGTFDDVADNLGVTNLRYPGGSITEDYFDIENPNNTTTTDSNGNVVVLMPLDEFMAYAGSAGNSVTIVIPTRDFLSNDTDGSGVRFENVDVAAITRFIKDVMAGVYGDADISAFEIGNEFSGSGQMTATEYGRVASALTRHIDTAIEEFITENQPQDGWVEPSIAVQAPFFSQVENQDILDQFSSFELTKVDAVTAHFYAEGAYSRITDEYNPKFNNLDTWQQATQQNIDYFVTEWNAKSPQSLDDGLRQASVMLEMMQRMIVEGVDAANVWPLQQNNETSLSNAEGVTTLTAAGQAFRWMSQSLIGTNLLDITPPNTNVDIHAFQGADRVIVFISSRTLSQTSIDLDFAALIPNYTHVFGQNLSVLDDVSTSLNEGDPEDHRALSYVTTFNQGDLTNGNNLSFNLGAYEVMRLEFTTGATGVEISGHDQTINNPIANYDDNIVGSSFADTLFGFSGNDTLFGGDGFDILSGGGGNDFIYGGAAVSDLRDHIFAGSGDDFVDGGFGNDLIFGQDGDDTLLGNNGADTLNGQDGNDVIAGGGGSDLISGNAGNDFINGGFGSDRINGGSGADRFYHLGLADHGSDWIQDYNAAAGDRLRFGQDGATIDQFQVNFTHTANAAGLRSGDAAVAEAFVIYRPTGQIIWALVDGSGQTEINLQLGSDVFDLLV